MMRVIRNATVAALLVLTGCADPELPKASSRLLDTNGGFTLYVSNHSSAIDPVDVRVEIDGELVVSDYVHYGTGHTVVPFGLSLTRGKHRIRIWSAKGDAELSREFELIDHDVGVVNYNYYPESQDNPVPRKFEFGTQKGPLWID